MTKSITKGKVGEREWAATLSTLLGVKARRGQQHHGGPDAPDVVCEALPIHWEVKRTEQLRLYQAINQATNDAGPNIPVVAHRKNNRPWLLIIHASDLPRLAHAITQINHTSQT